MNKGDDVTIHARQHVPGWADVEPWEDDFEDWEALRQKVIAWEDKPKFVRWSQSHFFGIVDSPYALMAEYDQGREWWVIAFCDRDLGLPEWKAQWE